jgi:tetratricopeptide (TPR) repeat protein
MLDFDFAAEFSRDNALNQDPKPRYPIDLRRRNFLIRFCQGASAVFLPAGLGRFATPFEIESPPAMPGEFRLHPHYRTAMPLDDLLLKTQAGLDSFVTEKYESQVARVLEPWSLELQQSPRNFAAIEKVLAPEFKAASLRPTKSQLLRSGPGLTIDRREFSAGLTLSREEFSSEIKDALAGFTDIVTAEFKVTAIRAKTSTDGAAELATEIRYDLVGTGKNFYRQERIGRWALDWKINPAGDVRLLTWRPLEETLARAGGPVFAEITPQAIGKNDSYAAQLLRGADYWRTILDVACGIDVYGHNGVSVGDIDNDGFDDLYVCQPAGLPNRLYHNRRDGTFEDITEASGLGVLDNTACALFVDVDNDGLQDLIVVLTTGPLLFLNQGGGKFRQKVDAFHFAKPPQGTFTGAAVADYDRDGWLDIYFCLYIYYQGTDQYRYPSPYYDAENGPPNFLLRNNRDGTFRDATEEAGLNHNNTRYSFCCGWSDFNRDGWPDLYVVNDFGRKNLYRNNGDGTFTDVAAEAGVEDVGAGMSVCWLDYDNDGSDDLYVANMWSSAGKRVTMQEAFMKRAPEEVRSLYRKHANGNSLFRNAGQGAFSDQSQPAGVEMGRWAWSSDAWDFDHDGFPDLYIANGMVSGPSREELNSFFWRQVVAASPADAKPSHNYQQGWSAINELIRSDGTWSGYERNVFYANNRDGSFSDVSGVAGLDFLEDGRAFAVSDFDHDGRLELFLKNRNGPQLRILKNVMADLAPSIAFRLRGGKSNRDAIGATVTLESELGRQTRTLQAGSGFLSQHTKELFFGLGGAKGPLKASIRWPSGLAQELHDLPINHRVWVEEGSATMRKEPFATATGASAPPVAPAPQGIEALPSHVETWLLAPVSAPDFSLPDLSGQTRTLSAFRGRPLLLNFWSAHSADSVKDLERFNPLSSRWAAQGLQLLAVNVDDPAGAESVRALGRKHQFSILLGSEDVAAIYNILFRYVYDRHRDLAIPTSFLIDEKGEIAKIYQGAIDTGHVEEDFRNIPQSAEDRLARALPFSGVTSTTEFHRNYLSLGSVYFQRGYFEQAEASFSRALRDDPQSAEALYGLGSVYLNQQKTAQAQENFERAVKLRASYPDTLPNAWNNLGLIAAREKRTDEAIGYFQEALKLSPDHMVALVNLGSAYRQQRRWDDARKTLERALEVNPQDSDANYSLAMVFAQTDDSPRAEEFLKKALQSRPDYPEALNNLGVLYLRTSRRDEAVAKFEECMRVAPAFESSYFNLARVYALEGAPEKARGVLLELLKQHPGQAQAEKMLSELPR